MDESGLSTVMKPRKGLCQRGAPVASQISMECGSHMTFVGFINAAGGAIPPVFIVAQKRMNPPVLRRTIHGTELMANPKGWNGRTASGVMELPQSECPDGGACVSKAIPEGPGTA